MTPRKTKLKLNMIHSYKPLLDREGVGTSKITTLKGQNVTSILKDDHNVERSERQKSER